MKSFKDIKAGTTIQNFFFSLTAIHGLLLKYTHSKIASNVHSIILNSLSPAKQIISNQNLFKFRILEFDIYHLTL